MQQEIKFAVLKFYHIGHSITGHIASCFGYQLYLISSFCLSFTSCQLMFFTYSPKLLVIHLLFNIYYIYLPGQAEIYKHSCISMHFAFIILDNSTKRCALHTDYLNKTKDFHYYRLSHARIRQERQEELTEFPLCLRKNRFFTLSMWASFIFILNNQVLSVDSTKAVSFCKQVDSSSFYPSLDKAYSSIYDFSLIAILLY